MYRELQGVAGCACDCNHHLPPLGELDGVAEQVRQHLSQASCVAHDQPRGHRARACTGGRSAAPGSSKATTSSTLSTHRAIEGAQLQIQPPGLDLGVVENVVDQVQQGLAARWRRDSSVNRAARGELRVQSSPSMPITAFIGVRISWLMVARNVLLASGLRRSAAACASRSCSSASLSWVMSTQNPWTYSGVPDVAHHHRLVMHPHNAPVGHDHAVVHAQRLAGSLKCALLGEHPFNVVGVEELFPQRVVVPVSQRVSEHRFGLGADVVVDAGHSRRREGLAGGVVVG